MMPGPHAAASSAGALSPDIAAWLNAVEGAREEESEDYPPAIRKRLLYVLQLGPRSGGLMVDLVSVELRRDGSMSDRTKHYTPSQLLHSGQQPRFLRPSDRRILRRLASLGGTGEDGGEFIDTLRLILATGRGR